MTCRLCPRTITRHSKSGLCVSCVQLKRDDGSVSMDGNRQAVTAVAKAVPKTLDQLLSICAVDPRIWAVDRWVANKWDVLGEPCYQVKAWLVRRPQIERVTEEVRALMDDAAKRMPKWKGSARRVSGDVALELAIPDLHLGKLAWHEETGDGDYDIKIACQRYSDAVETLIKRTAHYRIAKIILPIGNDFFHSDTKQGTTTKGTPLDTDSRYHKMFQAGRRLLIHTIERCRSVAPVEVVMVPGNHDALSSFHVGDSLSCWYRNTPDVTIRNEPTSRKYVRWGSVFILYTHGDKGKKTDYPLLMATERSKDFGQTKFREIHTGHLHMTKVDERHGVKTRISPALCSADAWHAESHFVGQAKAAEAYVWSKDDGLLAIAVYTVPEAA